MRILLLILLAVFLYFHPISVNSQTALDLNSQIQAKQQRIDDLKKRIDAYQTAILQKQAEAVSLRRQMSILNDKIASAELDIQTKELELDTVSLQIKNITKAIDAKDNEVVNKREKISEVMRQIYNADQKNFLEIFVLNPSLTKFFEQASYLETLRGTLQGDIKDLQNLRTEFKIKQDSLAKYKNQLTRAKQVLTQAQSNYQTQQDLKQSLLKQTQNSEGKFQTLLAASIKEQQQAGKDVKELEARVRKLLQSSSTNKFQTLADAILIWPVQPYRGLSTRFNDPDYVFRKYFEHPGIDIPTRQGTPIKAAADGYVARALDAGFGYSYILVIHKGGLSTVYGHVSAINVKEDTYVTKGQVIGSSGGLPGTRGAGRLTTGPHLHFEVRYNGIAVDPIAYLP